MRISIRSAHPDDAEAVASLLSQLGYPCDAPAARRRLEQFAQAEGRDRARVATLSGPEGERVVGVFTLSIARLLHRDSPTGQVTALVVDGRCGVRVSAGR